MSEPTCKLAVSERKLFEVLEQEMFVVRDIEQRDGVFLVSFDTADEAVAFKLKFA